MSVTKDSAEQGSAQNPVYSRQQKGHSLTKHILLVFVGVGLFTIPYITISKNHYWHA